MEGGEKRNRPVRDPLPRELREKIGKEIRNIRINKERETQELFANRIQVTFSSVSRWERGLAVPSGIVRKLFQMDYGLDIWEMIREWRRSHPRPTGKDDKGAQQDFYLDER